MKVLKIKTSLKIIKNYPRSSKIINFASSTLVESSNLSFTTAWKQLKVTTLQNLLFIFFPTVHNILIATGKDGDSWRHSLRHSWRFPVESEIISINENEDEIILPTCSRVVPNFPYSYYGAVGGNIGFPLICGTRWKNPRKGTKQCFKLEDNNWKRIGKTNAPKVGAASLIINGELTVFGGFCNIRRGSWNKTIEYTGTNIEYSLVPMAN